MNANVYGPGSDALLHRHIFGRQLAPSPDLKLAKVWLEECRLNHDKCVKPTDAQLPLRLLDLDNPDTNSLDLRLVAGTKEKGIYATLSHCWGKSQPLRLLRDNLAKFEKCIEFAGLPRTFQDAITVTRSLGLRYLWVDSLCIIQDSLSDWEKQCMEMARIYRDSYVTLAGPAASGCETGFLHLRPTSDQVTIQLDDEELELEVALSCYDVGGESHCFWPERDSPLAKRAWVLQERMLSGRTLYFGTSRMYLECHTNVSFEDCHYPIVWEEKGVDMVIKHKVDDLHGETDRFKYWYALVSTYSGLDITKRTDRLPAFSGLASEFGRLTRQRYGPERYHYAAGHWQEDMPRSLAWFTSPEDQTTERRHWASASASASVTQYIAPSWSWVSSPFKVKFLLLPGYPFNNELEKLEVMLEPAGLDPRGMLRSGCMDVIGRVLHGMVKRTGPQSANFRGSGRWPPPDTMEWYWDDHEGGPADEEGPEVEVDLLYFGLGEYRVCLILEPVVGQDNSYRRLGLVAERGNGHDFYRAWRVGSERKELRLV